MGIFLFSAGLICVLIAPPIAVSWSLWVLGGLIVGCVSVALLPVAWVGFPEWSANLRDIPGLVLPDCIAADPLQAGFWCLLLMMGVFIALYSLASPLDSRRMAAIAFVAVIGCSLYAVLAWGVWQGGWNYPFFEKPSFTQAAFGFFPNRNHTARFLVTWMILSVGLIHHEMTMGKLLRATVAAGCFALLVSVLLLFSVSRAGLVFLFLGVLLWMMGLGRYRSKALLMGGGGLFAVIMVFFVLSGSGLLERLKGSASGEARSGSLVHSVERDARIGIARDTMGMIADHPVTGTGLGSYAMVYPFYADKSLRDRTMALHAESDWLTLCSEGGLPSVLLVLLSLGLLCRRIPALRSGGASWPLRWAFLSAFFTELLHGLVDVPLHKPELGWWVLLLGGIGFANPGTLGAVGGISRRIQRILFVLAGIVMIGFGSLMLAAPTGRVPAMPPFAIAEIQRRVVAIFGDGHDPAGVSGAVAELRKSIALHPMAHQLYYQLAVLIIAIEDRVEQAKELFAVQRALSPIDPDLPYAQGMTLMRLDPKGAADCWNEALRRQLTLDHSPNSPIPRTAQLYGTMLSEAQGKRELFFMMQDLAAVDPELRLMWLGNPYADKEALPRAVMDTAFMESLSKKQRGRLFELWWARGDRAAVSTYLDNHPEDAEAAIATRAVALEAAGKQEIACRLLAEKFGIPVPAPVEPGAPIRSPGDDVPGDSLEAAKYFVQLGNDITARRLLLKALKSEDPSRRAECLLLLAQLEMRAGNWSPALRALLDYLHASGRL